MKTDRQPGDHAERTSSAPALGSVWTTLAGVRVHGIVSVRPAPAGRPDVVLVHGYAVSSRYMRPTAERLAGRYPVFAPDLPGYGLSDETKHVLDVKDLADLLAVWLDRRRIRRAVLVGNSFGCQMIADLAIRRPDLASHLVMIGPTADARARTMLRHVWRLARDFPHEPFALLLLQARDYLRFGPRWQWQTARHMLDDRIEDKLPLLRMPVLVVRGEHDPISPQDWVERLASLAPSGEVAVVRGAGHAVNYSAPDELAALIERFVGASGTDDAGRATREV
jgi:2-hydroxy-6-oxonona-2,4-dienedioate hydrolase